MLSSHLLLPGLMAALTSASPLRMRQDTAYTFSITDWSFGCSPAACAWEFNVTAPSGGLDVPAFGPIACSGNTLNDLDYIPCGPISDLTTVSAFVKASSESMVLYIKELVSTQSQGGVLYAGAVTTQETEYCSTCPTTYSIPVTLTTACTEGS